MTTPTSANPTSLEPAVQAARNSHEGIAEEQARLNDATPPPASGPPEPFVNWHELTWWEKRQRAATVVQLRREGIRAQRLRNRAERFQQRQNEVLSWFGKTNQLRGLDIQAGGAVDIVNAGAIQDGWLTTADGRRVKKAPARTLYLKRPLKAGPITIWMPGNPEPINEQSTEGLTDEMLLALPGGGLRNAFRAGNPDGLRLGKGAKWLLIGLVAVGLVGGAVWLYYRGVFG